MANKQNRDVKSIFFKLYTEELGKRKISSQAEVCHNYAQ